MKKLKLFRASPGSLYTLTRNQIYNARLDLLIVKHTTDKNLAIRILNRISNESCKVVDYLSTLLSCNSRLGIENNDPISKHSPQQAYQLSVGFLEELNRDQELYNATKVLYHSLTKEHIQKGIFLKKLIQDFEFRGGLDKKDEERRLISNIIQNIQQLQDNISYQLVASQKEIKLPVEILSKFSEIPKKIIKSCKIEEDNLSITVRVSVEQLNLMFLYNDDPAARNYIFNLIKSFSSQSSSKMTTELLSLRRQYAHLNGFKNYFDYNAAISSIYSYKNKNSNELLSVDEIESFSADLKTDLHRLKKEIIQELKKVLPKIEHLLLTPEESNKDFREILYYRHLITLRNRSLLSKLEFKLGDVFEFLRFFLNKWFDLEFKYTHIGFDIIKPDVKLIEMRLFLSGKEVGIVYLDLFARDGKTQAKQTLILQSHTDLRLHNKAKILQKPIMLITSTFNPTHTNLVDCMLNADQIATICHELGHCMHNLFSKNEYQFVMATFPIDYAEMMAVLSENIAELELYFLLALQHEELADISLQKDLLTPIEQFEQLFYALVDLNLHSLNYDNKEADEKVIHEAYRQTCEDINQCYGEQIIPKDVSDSAWIFNVEHLVNYGGSYYSYIIANHQAAAVVQKLTSKYLGSLAYQHDDSDPFYKFKTSFANLFKAGHSSKFFKEMQKIQELKLEEKDDSIS